MSACPLCGGTGRWVFWALGRSAALAFLNHEVDKLADGGSR